MALQTEIANDIYRLLSEFSRLGFQFQLNGARERVYELVKFPFLDNLKRVLRGKELWNALLIEQEQDEA